MEVGMNASRGRGALARFASLGAGGGGEAAIAAGGLTLVTKVSSHLPS